MIMASIKVIAGGQVITGACVSFTVTVKVQVAVLPAASNARVTPRSWLMHRPADRAADGMRRTPRPEDDWHWSDETARGRAGRVSLAANRCVSAFYLPAAIS